MDYPARGKWAAPGPVWVPLLPMLLFLGLALFSWERIPEGAAWLTGAEEHVTLMRTRGTGLLEGLAPVADPRALPATVALWCGLAPAHLALLGTWIGLLLGGGAILALSRRGARIGAWFLAAAPIWMEAALAGDPGILLGVIFLLLAQRVLPLWGEALLLGWALGWSPWAWVSLLLLPLLRRRPPDPGRYRGWATVALALVLLWITNPPALMNASGWGAAMLRQAQIVGGGGGATGIGLRAGVWPLWGTFHVTGLALLLMAMIRWPRRIRTGDGALLAILPPILLALRANFATLTPLLIILPFVAWEIDRGFGWLTDHLGRFVQRKGAALLLALLLVPVLFTSIARRDVRQVRDAQPAEVLVWLQEHLEPGSLIVHDMGFTPPEGNDFVWLAIPFHVIDPHIYRGAYWTGWYRGAAAYVISERFVVRFLREGERSRASLDFCAALVEAGIEDASFGDREGRRTRILLAPPPGNDPLGSGWREHIAGGRAGGVTGGFLASLGGALSNAGWPGSAVALLEEALSAGFADLGVYLNLANAYLDVGRTMEAGRVLDEARQHYPDSAELRYNLALVLTQAQLWDRAIRTLARLQSEWPRSAQVAYLLGVALANEARPAAARAQLERALELDPALPQRVEVEELLELLQRSSP